MTHDHTHLPHEHHTPSADEVVLISCVKHRYEDGTEVALCGLDFVATKGSRVAVLGPNGSGKTTMLYHVLGLLRAEEGHVRVFGVDPTTEWKAIRRRIGVVLQNVDEQILAPSVADDVGFSARQYGLPEAEVAERVRTALGLLGIEHLAERVPHHLSGGEKRKVAMAGALAMEPELLVLDEPFEGLDPFSRQQMVDLLEVTRRARGDHRAHDPRHRHRPRLRRLLLRAAHRAARSHSRERPPRSSRQPRRSPRATSSRRCSPSCSRRCARAMRARRRAALTVAAAADAIQEWKSA